jgi:hypothetical protein
MKTLESVLTRYEQNRQKVMGSVEKNEENIVNALLEQYKGLTYTNILDNTSKAQISFAKNAQNLLDIEDKELKELENLRTIKNALLEQNNILEDKSIILEETMVQKEQHLLNLKNLKESMTEEKTKLEKQALNLDKESQESLKLLNESIKVYDKERLEKLQKEEEAGAYEQRLKIQESKDTHRENISQITKDLEGKEHLKYKAFDAEQKELDENSNAYDISKTYIENFEEKLAEKVSKDSGTKLGFLKKEHENTLKQDSNTLVTQLEVLALDLENKIESCEHKKSMIEELKEKLNSAKSNLNHLTQNTLTV